MRNDAPFTARYRKVLRLKDGEEIERFDGRGKWRACSHSSGRGADFPLHATSRTPQTLTLFARITKGSRWDRTIEKATELGVTRIVPVVSVLAARLSA